MQRPPSPFVDLTKLSGSSVVVPSTPPPSALGLLLPAADILTKTQGSSNLSVSSSPPPSAPSSSNSFPSGISTMSTSPTGTSSPNTPIAPVAGSSTPSISRTRRPLPIGPRQPTTKSSLSNLLSVAKAQDPPTSNSKSTSSVITSEHDARQASTPAAQSQVPAPMTPPPAGPSAFAITTLTSTSPTPMSTSIPPSVEPSPSRSRAPSPPPPLSHRSSPAPASHAQSLAPSPSASPRPPSANTMNTATLPIMPIIIPQPPPMSFDPPPPKYRPLTLDAAQWSLSSHQLQAVVSRAIRRSAEESSIRLLPLEVLDGEVGEDIESAKRDRESSISKLRFSTMRRTMLLQSLGASITSSSSGNSQAQAQSTLLLNLASLLKESDSYTQTLLHSTSNVAALHSLAQNHASSALAVALRKLNASYVKKVREVQELKARVQALEGERDEAWRVAEELAREMDDAAAQVSAVFGLPGHTAEAEAQIAQPQTLPQDVGASPPSLPVDADQAEPIQISSGVTEPVAAENEDDDNDDDEDDEDEDDPDVEDLEDITVEMVNITDRAIAVPATLQRTSRLGGRGVNISNNADLLVADATANTNTKIASPENQPIRTPGTGPRNPHVQPQNVDFNSLSSGTAANVRGTRSRSNSVASRVSAARVRSIRASEASLRMPIFRRPSAASSLSGHGHHDLAYPDSTASGPSGSGAVPSSSTLPYPHPYSHPSSYTDAPPPVPSRADREMAIRNANASGKGPSSFVPTSWFAKGKAKVTKRAKKGIASSSRAKGSFLDLDMGTPPQTSPNEDLPDRNRSVIDITSSAANGELPSANQFSIGPENKGKAVGTRLGPDPDMASDIDRDSDRDSEGQILIAPPTSQNQPYTAAVSIAQHLPFTPPSGGSNNSAVNNTQPRVVRFPLPDPPHSAPLFSEFPTSPSIDTTAEHENGDESAYSYFSISQYDAPPPHPHYLSNPEAYPTFLNSFGSPLAIDALSDESHGEAAVKLKHMQLQQQRYLELQQRAGVQDLTHVQSNNRPSGPGYTPPLHIDIENLEIDASYMYSTFSASSSSSRRRTHHSGSLSRTPSSSGGDLIRVGDGGAPGTRARSMLPTPITRSGSLTQSHRGGTAGSSDVDQALEVAIGRQHPDTAEENDYLSDGSNKSIVGSTATSGDAPQKPQLRFKPQKEKPRPSSMPISAALLSAGDSPSAASKKPWGYF